MPGKSSNFPPLLIPLPNLQEINVSNSYIIFHQAVQCTIFWRNVFLCCWKTKVHAFNTHFSIYFLPCYTMKKIKVWKKFISLKASSIFVNFFVKIWCIARFTGTLGYIYYPLLLIPGIVEQIIPILFFRKLKQLSSLAPLCPTDHHAGCVRVGVDVPD